MKLVIRIKVVDQPPLKQKDVWVLWAHSIIPRAHKRRQKREVAASDVRALRLSLLALKI